MPFLLIALGVGLIGLLAYWGWAKAKQRREALAALAAELGWRFDPSRDTSHDEEYAHFEVFRRGHSRSAYNTLTGTLEVDGRRWPVKTGDFLYKVTSSNGKTTTTHTHHFSYLILHLPFSGVPDLLIRREGLFDKLAGVFGFDDIDFESEEFSRRFCVKSPEKKFAYAVVHPRMMEFLLAEQPPAIDIERGRCCLTDGRRSWDVAEFRASLDLARRFFGHWPEHLVVQLEAS
ncbi:MAG: hypothetical protein ACYTG2_07160 [Planctomycetota bacterium]|jgi:hypothetical protein